MYQEDLLPFVIELVEGFQRLSLESTSNSCLLQMDFLGELLYPSVRRRICSVILTLVDVLLKVYGRHMTYRTVRGMRFSSTHSKSQDQRSRSPLNHYTRIRRLFVSRRDLKRVLLRSIF